jgi:hypothetical protein
MGVAGVFPRDRTETGAEKGHPGLHDKDSLQQSILTFASQTQWHAHSDPGPSAGDAASKRRLGRRGCDVQPRYLPRKVED